MARNLGWLREIVAGNASLNHFDLITDYKLLLDLDTNLALLSSSKGVRPSINGVPGNKDCRAAVTQGVP